MVTLIERKLPQTSGVLFKDSSFRHISLRQFVVDNPASMPWLDHLWLVQWDMPKGETYNQATLPYPTCHIVLDPQKQSGLFGCSTGRFNYVLTGKGAVIGARLHPGGFRAFLSESAYGLKNSCVSLDRILNSHRQITTGQISEPTVARFAELLNMTAQPLPKDANLVRHLVETIRDAKELFRIADLENTVQMSPRKLQRLFREFIGVGPKWTIDRFRMFEAVETIYKDDGANLADLAARLGYSDQPHFSRVFKSVTGVSPGQYAAS